MREVREILVAFLRCNKFASPQHPELSRLHESLKQLLKEDTSLQAEPTTLQIEHFASTIGKAQSGTGKQQLYSVELNDFYLGELAKKYGDEIRTVLLDLGALFSKVTLHWLHDFAFIIPSLRDELYSQYAQ